MFSKEKVSRRNFCLVGTWSWTLYSYAVLIFFSLRIASALKIGVPVFYWEVLLELKEVRKAEFGKLNKNEVRNKILANHLRNSGALWAFRLFSHWGKEIRPFYPFISYWLNMCCPSREAIALVKTVTFGNGELLGSDCYEGTQLIRQHLDLFQQL